MHAHTDCIIDCTAKLVLPLGKMSLLLAEDGRVCSEKPCICKMPLDVAIFKIIMLSMPGIHSHSLPLPSSKEQILGSPLLFHMVMDSSCIMPIRKYCKKSFFFQYSKFQHVFRIKQEEF